MAKTAKDNHPTPAPQRAVCGKPMSYKEDRMKLNLEAKTPTETRVLQYLENNASTGGGAS